MRTKIQKKLFNNWRRRFTRVQNTDLKSLFAKVIRVGCDVGYYGIAIAVIDSESPDSKWMFFGSDDTVWEDFYATFGRDARF